MAQHKTANPHNLSSHAHSKKEPLSKSSMKKVEKFNKKIGLTQSKRIIKAARRNGKKKNAKKKNK